MLALQRDPHIFQRGQMRKHRRNLERAHQAKPRHIGRRHRRDVLSLVENLAGRGLQELGQQIEARRLAGPVRTDQRVNAATADPQIDIANGEEPREFLGQSVGFENELIGQSNFPHQPSRDALARGQFFRTGRFQDAWNGTLEIRPGPAVSGRNMPSTARFRQGAKLVTSGGRTGAGIRHWSNAGQLRRLRPPASPRRSESRH